MNLELSRMEMIVLEECLQRDATDLLSAGVSTDDPAYRANRHLFVKVWDALYA